jgi:hypothetical protein
MTPLHEVETYLAGVSALEGYICETIKPILMKYERCRMKAIPILSCEINFRSYCYEFGALCVTYKTGFGFAHWIYWHRIHTTRNYKHHSAITDMYTLQFTVTHVLGFSVSTSRVLATELHV